MNKKTESAKNIEFHKKDVKNVETKTALIISENNFFYNRPC